ncbi:MAG: leucine-rich repeat domain-containing protein [Bacteroidaceae bacterium]|nr:leucine-rich repeat domain-containing protein [Bacteroidaceae bacterium]
MKTFKHLFTTLLLLCAAVATAHDFEVNGIYYNITDATKKTVAVTYKGISYSYYNEYTGSVVIPESVTYNATTYSVTSIGYEAFRNCYGLTSITIPNSVTSIGNWAFHDCSGLTSVVIGNSVTSIGYEAFRNCSGLTSVTIPNSVTSIGNNAFAYCSGLTSIEIGNSVTSIGEDAFYNCSGLTSVTIGNSVTSIGLGAFERTAWYNNQPDGIIYAGKVLYEYKGTMPANTSITIKEGTLGITAYAFEGCTGLTSITIPNSVTSIGSSAFYGCSGLKKAIWLTNTPPSGYTNVNAACNYVANNQYSGLSNVRVYSYLSSMFEVDGVRYVPVSPAERTCDAIDCTYNDTTSVDIIIGKTVSFKGIAMNVKEIMPYTLYANKKIKSVKVENEGNIGDYAFYGCTALETANISNNGNIGDYAFNGSFKTASSTVTISNKGNIGNYAFYGCTALETANISNEGNIGNYAFNGSFKTASSTVTISNKGSIGNYAFGGCNYLVEATLGDSVTSVGTEAFSGCSGLKGIEIPDNVTAVGSKAFYGCSSLKSAKIGAGVAAINEATFSGCSAMTLIAIGENIATIGKNAFYGCSSLEEITIPQAVTKIENYAFDNCSSLADVIIEDNSTALSLGSNGSSPLFADCPLDSMYIGRKINYSTSSSYGYSPFYRNASLRTVVITDTETEIYDNEFYGCSNLKNVSIGNGVKKIGKWAFSGCSSLDYFAFGENVESIGSEAFSDCNNVTRILTNAMTPPVCGAQALDDINKWNCSLFVPNEAKSAYLLAEQWKEFFFIEDLPLGINDVVDDENYNGTPGVYYDLNGRVVEKPTNGIYIKNGKKVLIK